MKNGTGQAQYNLQEAREKIRHYCAYRERSHREVRDKLYSYGLGKATVNELLTELIQHNYLSEERFALAFVRGKFYQKKWGRQKIRQALYHHGISDYLLAKAFDEIKEEDYDQGLQGLIAKKEKTLKENNPHIRRRKLAAFAIRKGYESERVWDLLRRLDQ